MPWLSVRLEVPSGALVDEAAFWAGLLGEHLALGVAERPGVVIEVHDGDGPDGVVADWGSHRSSVDQVSVDVPRDAYDDACALWSERLGEPVVPSRLYDEFRFVEGRPLRVLVQRLGEATGPSRAHLDLATDDRDAEVRRHEALGGRVVRRTEHWTTLVDPAGIEYCVTTRTP